MQIIMDSGAVVGVYSFTTGFVPRNRTLRKMTEDDVLAAAMWLERYVSTEAGLELIARWESGVVLYH